MFHYIFTMLYFWRQRNHVFCQETFDLLRWLGIRSMSFSTSWRTSWKLFPSLATLRKSWQSFTSRSATSLTTWNLFSNQSHVSVFVMICPLTVWFLKKLIRQAYNSEELARVTPNKVQQDSGTLWDRGKMWFTIATMIKSNNFSNFITFMAEMGFPHFLFCPVFYLWRKQSLWNQLFLSDGCQSSLISKHISDKIEARYLWVILAFT